MVLVKTREPKADLGTTVKTLLSPFQRIASTPNIRRRGTFDVSLLTIEEGIFV